MYSVVAMAIISSLLFTLYHSTALASKSFSSEKLWLNETKKESRYGKKNRDSIIFLWWTYFCLIVCSACLFTGQSRNGQFKATCIRYFHSTFIYLMENWLNISVFFDNFCKVAYTFFNSKQINVYSLQHISNWF